MASDLSRAVSPGHVLRRYIIYTYAPRKDSARRCRISVILIDRQSGRILEVPTTPDPRRVVALFGQSADIYGLELSALAAAFADWRKIISGSHVAAYVDNDPSPNALLREAANFPAAHNCILRFWVRIPRLPISVWFEGVPSPAHMENLPTVFRDCHPLFFDSRFPYIN